ncbi:hypothetical protein AX761_24345 [Rhizobium sp. 58]|nr:hypothetical protein AX761_24345 [Rhizobium sp. 58]
MTTHAQKIARHEALAEALRALDEAIGDEEPTDQAFRVIAAIKRLRDGDPVRVASLSRIDYLSRLQTAAKGAWIEAPAKSPFDPATLPFEGFDISGREHDAIAGIDTPLGRLRMVTWRRRWTGKRGERTAWAGEYYLNDEPITVAEIKAAGLAQRPTTRNRQKRNQRN